MSVKEWSNVQVLVCCGNCPEWYRVTEYSFENQTRSDCINAYVYGFNDSTVIQRNRRIYYSTFFAVGYAVPLTIICAFYILLMRRIGRRGRFGVDSSEVLVTSLKATATRRRVMRMVTSVIATFAICWLPTHVSFLVEAFASVHEYYRIEMVTFQIIATCLAYANSCLNPVIYAFLSENFRQSFRELLAGGSRVDRRQVSGVRRSSRGDAINKQGGRPSAIVVDGHQALPMMPIKLSTPQRKLSGMRTMISEAF